jgi:hypothetical protein
MNRVRIEADSALLDEIVEAVKLDDVGIGSVDFNKVIPMPPELDVEEGSRSSKALEICRDMVERGLKVILTYDDSGVNIEVSGDRQEDINAFSLNYLNDIAKDNGLLGLGKICLHNMAEYGVTSWYDWRVANWGTKWNSYGYDDSYQYEQGNGVIRFDTAWGTARPVIKKMSEMYPDATFHMEWADEDIGQNLGAETYQGGDVIDSYYPVAGSPEAYRFAIKLRGTDACAVSKDGSQIVYTDEPLYKSIMFDGKIALYTEEELGESDVPEGMYMAYLYLSADGKRVAAFRTLNPLPDIKFLGSMISKESLNLDRDKLRVVPAKGFLDIKEENVTIDEYMHDMECDTLSQQVDVHGSMKIT